MNRQEAPIQVLHVTFDMGIGGTEQVIRQLVTHLPKAGYRHRILCIDGRIGPIGQELKAQGIDILSIGRTPGLDRRLISEIRKLILEHSVDLVHCHQYTPWVYGLLASIRTPARVVFTEHGRFYPDRHRYKAILANPLMAGLTDAVVAISSATRDALRRYEFIPKWRVEVIYNGIEGWAADTGQAARVRRELGIPAGDPVLGTVARLDPVKNQGMMLRAFAGVLAQVPQAWLVLVGDGPERESLEKLSGELGIGHRVRFTGFKTQPVAYMNAMDLFLLSSHTEGTSMTLLEAMSLGVPTVATRVGGNPEIVLDEKTGLLTPPEDARAFQAAILRLLEDAGLRRRLSSAAVERFKQEYSVQSMQNAYAGLYHRVLKRPVTEAPV